MRFSPVKSTKYILSLFLIFFYISVGLGQTESEAGDISNYEAFINQTVNKPDNYSFYNYAKEGSVDLLTGRFGLEVNFHTIETEYVKLPISLFYSTSGVPLNKISNEVAIDWHMSAGGSITREIKGIQDDISRLPISSAYRFNDDLGNFLGSGYDLANGSYSPNLIKFIKTSYGGTFGNLSSLLGSWYITHFPKTYYSRTVSESETFVEFGKYEKWPTTDAEFGSVDPIVIDTEPDVFRCRIADLDFSFIMKRKFQYYNSIGNIQLTGDASNYFEAVAIDEIGIKIKFFTTNIPFHDKRKTYSKNGNVREEPETVITKFEVTDKKGIVYTFENMDLIDTDVIQQAITNYSYAQNNSRVFQWKTYSTSSNNWKVTSIKQPDNQVISFNYIANKYLLQNRVPRMHDGQYKGYAYNLSPANPSYALNVLDQQIEGYSLADISYQNQKVKFIYSNYRPDLRTGGKNLTKMELWNSDTKLIKSFTFNKTYSYADLNGGHEDFRMFLTGIDDSTKEKSFVFNYDNIDALRPRDYVQYQDIFGYSLGYMPITNPYPSFPVVYINKNAGSGNKISYEVPATSDYLTIHNGADRAVRLDMPKFGTLNKITFPTGGELSIEYENNTYYDPSLMNKKALGPGVRVKELKYYSVPGIIAKRKEYAYNNFLNDNLSSGTLLYRPSFSYLTNWNFNNDYNLQNHAETKVYQYNNDGSWEYYKHYNFDNSYSKERLAQAGYSENQIYPKMLRISTHSLGRSSDHLGREIIYANVQEKEVDVEDSSKSFYSRYYFNNVDNRTRVSSVGGPSDEPSEYTPGSTSLTVGIYSPYLNSYGTNSYLKTLSGYIEKQGYDIFPFPERDFFGSLEKQLFGKLVKKELLNNNLQKVLTEEYTYNQITISSGMDDQNTLKSVKKGYLKVHQYRSDDPTQAFATFMKLTNGPRFYADSHNHTGQNMFAVTNFKYDSKIVVSQKKSTSHFTTGDMVQQYDYKYTGNIYGNLSEEKSQNSYGEELRTIYAYPTINDDKPWLARMLEKNILTPYRLAYQNLGRATDLVEKEFAYKQWPNGSVLLESVSTAKGNSSLDTKMTITKRDNLGNILEYTEKNNAPVSMIWGYNRTVVVAKIENISYSSIPVSLISNIESASSNSGSEAALLSALSALRNDAALSNSMATTYTYIPLVGVSTITDLKGDRMTYTYDAAGRLEFVKDKLGNILSEYQYNYKQ